jgi:ribonuclease HII
MTPPHDRMLFQGLVEFDSTLRRTDQLILAGVDEAGRGALAGPVVAAAVVCDPCEELSRVRDSKMLSENEREEIYEKIVVLSHSFGIGRVGPGEIDRINILQATMQAMKEAVANLGFPPDLVVVDGIHRPAIEGEVTTVKGGDNRSFSVAAASVLAKVTRDRIMRRMAKYYPGYGFIRNKGYGTREHIDCIRKNGLTGIHRRSFKVVHN